MLPITKPTLSPFSRYAKKFKDIIESGILTNGKNVRKFEESAAKYLGVKYCVAVSSCTSGLMLIIKGLGLKGEIVLPSFTFSATGHAVLWNNLKPVFADIESQSYQIDPTIIEKFITPATTGILAVHMFGNPCEVKALENIAKKRNLKLIFDSAHAFGASSGKKKIGGFGNAEVFSLSPTKLLTSGEGGLIATNDKALADFCRIGRNYGDDGSYNTQFNGLNARMSEMHAVIALESLKSINRFVRQRNVLAKYFKNEIIKIDPKIEFQRISSGNLPTYKDFSIYIDPKISGYTRDELHDYLASKQIVTKKYFYPPLHEQIAYDSLKKQNNLPITEKISRNVLSLPFYSHISRKEIAKITSAIKSFYNDIQKRKKILL